jgi:hypothetical protein
LEAGINSTVSLHVFCGDNRRGQFVADDPANPNTCGLVDGTVNARGLAKVIGGPPRADELLSVNVTDFSCPTFTLPKFPDGGLIFKFPRPEVAVAVGVGVPVALAVDVAVTVGVAVTVLVAVGVANPVVDAVGVEVVVAVGVPLAVGVAVGVGEGTEPSNSNAPISQLACEPCGSGRGAPR